jgi:transketolase
VISEVLEYSRRRGLAHVPSALSMLDYLRVLFEERFVVPNRDRIVIGKPFGAQAYYVVWRKLGYLEGIDGLSYGVKAEEVPFVDFSEETLGNALGVAAGIAMCTGETVWANVSDAALQMGPTLEAVQFIGHRRMKNMRVTVDFNGMQVTGATRDIVSLDRVASLFGAFGWRTYDVDGHDRARLSMAFGSMFSYDGPAVAICRTVKGRGVKEMEADPVGWHYRRLGEGDAR